MPQVVSGKPSEPCRCTLVAISSNVILAESSLWHSPSHRPWLERCFCNLLFFYCFISQIKWLTIFIPDFFSYSIKYLARVRQYTRANRKWLTSTLELEWESVAKERLGDQSWTLRDESREPAGIGGTGILKGENEEHRDVERVERTNSMGKTWADKEGTEQ